MQKRNDITETLKTIRHDLKAEIIIADLISTGLESDDFVVVPNGTFKRRYSSDIAYTSPLKLQNGHEPVGIYVNRDAIYDLMPEGFFHEKSDLKKNEPDPASKGSKKIKAEEKAARSFFLPFENELFWHKINLELEERKILFRFSENIFENLTPDFWNLDASADPVYVLRMVKYLQISYRFTGNCYLTGKCLGQILNEEVMVMLTERSVIINENIKDPVHSCCCLGSASLGSDFICSDSLTTTENVLHFLIGPVRNSRITDYLEKGPASEFLKCFAEFFVPAGLDVITTVLAAPYDYNFTLGSEGSGCMLGYTAVTA